MTTEELYTKLANISDKDLAEMASKLVSDLCHSGGAKFTMTVPVRETDSDMILCELIRRFKAQSESPKAEPPEQQL